MNKKGEPDGLSLPYFKPFKLYRIYADEFAIVYGRTAEIPGRTTKGNWLFFNWKGDQDGNYKWDWFEANEEWLKDNMRYTRTKLSEEALPKLIKYLFSDVNSWTKTLA